MARIIDAFHSFWKIYGDVLYKVECGYCCPHLWRVSVSNIYCQAVGLTTGMTLNYTFYYLDS